MQGALWKELDALCGKIRTRLYSRGQHASRFASTEVSLLSSFYESRVVLPCGFNKSGFDSGHDLPGLFTHLVPCSLRRLICRFRLLLFSSSPTYETDQFLRRLDFAPMTAPGV